MKKFTLLLIASAALLFSFKNGEDPTPTISSKGVGEAKINQSNYREVKKAFPGGKTTKQVWGGKKVTKNVRFTHGETVQIKTKPPKQTAVNYTLQDKGISFYFNFLDTLSSITVFGENDYQTDKGIKLGKSTFSDLDSLYGKSSFGRIHSRLVKTHGNLIFYANESIVMDDTFTLKAEFDQLKIAEIEIVID